MQSDLPKTINEAIKILAYNDYFWKDATKNRINPHPKDFETVRSLAEAQYSWTEKQGKLAVVILKRYQSKFMSNGMDIRKLLDNPSYEQPFRVINFEKIIEKFQDEKGWKIELKFPYNKKLVGLIRCLRDKKGLPEVYSQYDGEHKKWTFNQTDVTTYFLTLVAIRYDFKFVDKTLLDDYYTVREEIKNYKQPTARLVGTDVVIDNASNSLTEYWSANVKGQKLIRQIDRLKEFGIDTKGLKVKSWSNLGGKIACCNYNKAWINKEEFSKDHVLNALLELDCFPIVMPVSGNPNTQEDAEQWREWLDTFQKHGIDYKHLAFGFDIKEPKKFMGERTNYNDNIIGNMSENLFQTLYDVYQASKQFKFVDKETKILFVRNRIPKTLIKSEIKPKCCLVAMGGGYYTSGTDNLKRYLDSLPKTLYYNDHQPSNWDWRDRVIVKL